MASQQGCLEIREARTAPASRLRRESLGHAPRLRTHSARKWAYVVSCSVRLYHYLLQTLVQPLRSRFTCIGFHGARSGRQLERVQRECDHRLSELQRRSEVRQLQTPTTSTLPAVGVYTVRTVAELTQRVAAAKDFDVILLGAGTYKDGNDFRIK